MLLIKVEQIINCMKTKDREGFRGNGKFGLLKVDTSIVLDILIHLVIDLRELKLFFKHLFWLGAGRMGGIYPSCCYNMLIVFE